MTQEIDRRTLFKFGLGAAVAAVVGTELLTEAGADATPSAKFPWIIDCDSWGARPPYGTIQITGNTTNKIILHHMDFPNVTDYSREHAVAARAGVPGPAHGHQRLGGHRPALHRQPRRLRAGGPAPEPGDAGRRRAPGGRGALPR